MVGGQKKTHLNDAKGQKLRPLPSWHSAVGFRLIGGSGPKQLLLEEMIEEEGAVKKEGQAS